MTYASAAALTAGLTTGCSESAEEHDSTSENAVRVQIEAPKEPLVARTFAILADRIQQRCPVNVIEAKTNAHIILALNPQLDAEAFQIDAVEGAVRIAGGAPQGLLYGVGKFLRTSGYGSTFQPSPWRGTSAPQGSMRGMYFATHFHNWCHQASKEEITRYMEDLVFWGMNAAMVIFPMINLKDWDDPQAAPAMEMVRQYAKAARDLKIQFVTGLNNAMFTDAPESILATRLPDPTGRRGNFGHNVCPSNPEGHAYIMKHTRQLFENLADVGLDAVCFWPFDEGGCACEQCRPWGKNGFLRLSRDQVELGREYFPELKAILSTWMFDTPPSGEWQGLADSLADDKSWANYILADSHGDFPRYPLDEGVPGDLPLLNFPEISMWGNWPWGGLGANPLPARYQRLWDQVKHIVEGGFPYSEGIYEDMNKAVVQQFYWNRDHKAQATLEEYIAYEFGLADAADVLAIVDILETTSGCTYLKKPIDSDAVMHAAQLAESVEARLPDWGKNNWRWEILKIRTVLERERLAEGGMETPVAEAAMLRLVDLYHCQLVTDDPYHHRVRPRLKQAVSRNGEL